MSEDELEDLRERFKSGQYSIDIEQKTFSMAEYNAMIASECSAQQNSGEFLCYVGSLSNPVWGNATALMYDCTPYRPAAYCMHR